jgi:hypothetical protein
MCVDTLHKGDSDDNDDDDDDDDNNNNNMSTLMMAFYSRNGYVVIYHTHDNYFYISLTSTKNVYITHFTCLILKAQ